MISKYPQPQELRAELDVLNAEVTAVLAKRRAWMDVHMEDFSNFKIRDEVYDISTGQYLGTVTKLYRYWGNQNNPLYDYQMAIEIQLSTGDNSSRYAGGGPQFGTREEARSAAESRAKYLAWKARGSDWSEVFK